MSESFTTNSLPTFSIDFGSIRSMLEYRFTVKDAYVDINGVPIFVIVEEPIKRKFQELLQDLGNHHLTAKIQRVADKLVISVFPKPTLNKPRARINLLLFLVTIASVTFASYTLVSAIDPRLTAAFFSGSSVEIQVVVLAVSLIGIVGIHELGHLLAVRHHKMDATLPYFLPVPFGFGTFGALISLRAPPGNRDQLFDLGFSGPIAGFIATIAVALFAYLTAPLLSQQQVLVLLRANLLTSTSWPNEPLLLDVMTNLGVRVVPTGHILVLTHVVLAVEFGALITFLNLLPVWQLDGGHIARATYGGNGHILMTLVGIYALYLAGFSQNGYWVFAAMLIGLMTLSRRPLQGLEPLDDVSPLSASRKVMYPMALAMLVLCFFIFTF